MASKTSRSTVLCLGLCLAAFAAAVGACATPAVVECGNTGVLCPAGTHCAALQGICIPDSNTCGDGRHDPDEVCEDGNTLDGDGCSRDCMSDETCGNHITDLARHEVCDDGNNVDGDKCSHDCLSLETCGNHIVDKGEVCDDGNNDDADGCSHDCLSDERCGNGITDTAVGEICDLVPADPAKCSADCKSSIDCGNAILDPGEECDLGMSVNSTTGECRPDCIVNRCGDGYTNMTGLPGHLEHVEQCDAAPPAPKDSRTLIPTQTAACNLDCTFAQCRDGKVNPLNTTSPATALGEACDDNNPTNGDGCDNNCTVTACGNGVMTAPEQCDDSNLIDNDGCDHNCKIPGCGNGVINGSEQCDDGNLTDGDGCDRNCKFTRCGNGIETTGEDCDDGNTVSGDACSSTCRDEVCGNGIVDPLEECDNGLPGTTGGNSDTGDCRTDCVINRCGDGHTNTSLGPNHEDCDAGPRPTVSGDRNATPTETSGCNIDCTNPDCGDGKVNRHFGEDCDNGQSNNTEHNDCTDLCKDNVCGDHKQDTQGPIQEQCDDGNTADGDNCSATCRNERCGNAIVDDGEECDNGAPGSPGGNDDEGDCRTDCVINRCGDGHTNRSAGPNHEQCDGGPRPTLSGDRSATPTDTANCNSNCTNASCGDHIVNRAFKPTPTTFEQCDDDGNDNGDGCSATCQLETCGNHIVDVHEQCDDGNQTPGDTCEPDCTRPRCGNGIPDVGEQCDDGNASNTDTCTNACRNAGCGDGFIQGTEDCDDLTRPLPTDCPYNRTETGCDVCNASCDLVPGNTLFCGDGITQQPQEICDRGNRGCGACNAGCNAVISEQATGLILASGAGTYTVGDRFTLGDGVISPLVFELTTTGTIGSGRLPVLFLGTASAAQVAGKIAEAIGNTTLHISTRVVGGAVLLTHQRPTTTGNVLIVPTVATASTLVVDGMSGGQGGQCLGAQPCKDDRECASNNCSGELCVAP